MPVVDISASRGSAADWLAELASALRERKTMPSSIVVLALSRGDSEQVIEHFSGPGLLSPTDFVGIVEMGKITYLTGDSD